MIPRYTRPEMGAIWTDQNRFDIWLRIEILACESMHQLGEIPEADLNRIKKRATFTVDRILQIEEEVHHDVIAFLTAVAENVGPSSRFIHKGLTSSDVLDTALAVQMVEAMDLLIRGAKNVQRAAKVKARRYKKTPMIGRSHGIHAEPITFGLKMALMADEFSRVITRLEAARETVRVGQLSGAVGTHAHLSPRVERYVCSKLKLKPATLSTQVLQRDRHAEYMCAIAQAGATVERWATEFRHLQRTEVLEVEEHFGSDQKGSSAMPHKKNPIIGERLTGMARLLRGYSVAALENVALWHERDISHSSVERVILPDGTIALDYMFVKLEALVRTLKVHPKRMQANMDATHGLIHSQQVLLLLIDKGMTREKAYRVVQANAMKSWDEGTGFRDLLLADKRVTSQVSEAELNSVFDLKNHLRDIDRKFKKLGI